MHSAHALSNNRDFLIDLTLTLTLSSLIDRGAHVSSLFLSRNFNALSDRALSATLSTLSTLGTDNGAVNIVDRIRTVGRHVPIRVGIGGVGNLNCDGLRDAFTIGWLFDEVVGARKQVVS